MPSFAPWPPLSKLVNPDGSAAQAFLLLVQQIHDDVKALEASGAALTEQQAGAQDQANAAAEQAAAAYEDTTGATTQDRSADLVKNVNSTDWALGPVVTFSTAVAVAHVTAADSGPLYYGDYKAPVMTGDIRLVQIISAVETVLETVPFSADNDSGSLDFAGFTYDAASAATGTVQYRIDAKTNGGTISGLGLRCHILRAV